LVYKATSTHEDDSQFSPQMVLVVLRIFCVVSVVWSAWVRGSFHGF